MNPVTLEPAMVAAANNINPGDINPDHIFRIYVVYPSPIRASRVPDYHTNTGHVFISLAEPDKGEQFLGFNAAFQVLGRDRFGPEDLIHGIQDFLKPVQGIVSDESRYMRAVHDVMEYLITPEQFQKIQDRVHHWRNEKPDYILALRNCVSFACDLAEAAGLKPPAQILGLHTPLGTGLGITLGKWRQNRLPGQQIVAQSNDSSAPQTVRQNARPLQR